MKTLYNYKTALLALAAIGLSACNGLDELPDNRTAIDSSDKVASLMTSAYPLVSPAVLCEYSSDNLVDDNVVVPATHSSAYSDWLDEAYQWKDIEKYSLGTDDTPYQVWEQYYAGISVCNHAIVSMQEMSSDPAHDSSLSATWGEAHVLRAYLHFVLVNVFAEAYKNDQLSQADRGIPYVTKPEDVVSVDYSTSEFLHNVKVTYDLIEQDLLEGLPYITDNYSVPAYHFNKNAANAFAARFYLFKRDYAKSLAYANEALGTNAATMMRKWSTMNMNTAYTKRDSYWDETANCNFLLLSTYSLQWRYIIGTTRYSINTGSTVVAEDGKTYTIPSSLDISLWGEGPNWSGSLPCYNGCVYVNGAGQQYGCYRMSLIEYFEYTDKIAGIGYVHMLYEPFSAEETLLCRAEAKLYQGDRAGALSDLNVWTNSKASSTKTLKSLTESEIKSFYSRAAENQYCNELHPSEMGFSKVLTDATDQAYLDCILHFRRIETLHNGDRWYDIKRYGMTVRHFWRGPNEDAIHVSTLTYNDPRRVMQIPNSVIEAGYPSTNRTSTSTSSGSTGYQVNTAGSFNTTFTTKK